MFVDDFSEKEFKYHTNCSCCRANLLSLIQCYMVYCNSDNQPLEGKAARCKVIKCNRVNEMREALPS